MVVFPEGFSDAQFKELESAIKENVPAIISPNFSIGVNVFWNLIAAAAKHLQAYQYHMEIKWISAKERSGIYSMSDMMRELEQG